MEFVEISESTRIDLHRYSIYTDAHAHAHNDGHAYAHVYSELANESILLKQIRQMKAI